MDTTTTDFAPSGVYSDGEFCRTWEVIYGQGVHFKLTEFCPAPTTAPTTSATPTTAPTTSATPTTAPTTSATPTTATPTTVATVYYTYSLQGVTFNDAAQACAAMNSYSDEAYGAENYLNLCAKLYSNISLTIPYVGDGRWYSVMKDGDKRTAQIASDGTVSGGQSCYQIG